MKTSVSMTLVTFETIPNFANFIRGQIPSAGHSRGPVADVIRQVIEEMNMVAIARTVLTSREHIIALEPRRKGITGTLLSVSL